MDEEGENALRNCALNFGFMHRFTLRFCFFFANFFSLFRFLLRVLPWLWFYRPCGEGGRLWPVAAAEGGGHVHRAGGRQVSHQVDRARVP